MKRLICLLLLVALSPAQEDPAAGVPAQVRALFAQKCSQCHGGDLVRPKGRFGYAEDLARVAKRYVKAGDADESELWWYLTGEQEQMPPKNAKNGPLSLSDLALVRWWIRDGAKAPLADASSATPEVEGSPSLVAKSHVLFVHFPIALVFAALLAEVLFMWRGGLGVCNTGRFCITFAALSACVTAFTGWSAAESWSPGRVETHRWLAVAALCTSTLAALVCPLAARRGGWPRRSYRLLLVVAAALVMLAGHQGGLLVHGRGYFDL